jgi:hypothetical protein
MRLQTAISCVNYDDFLAATLPRNLPHLDAVTVITSPNDRATVRLAKQLGVQLFITDAWHSGGPLNKALALNQWVTHASAFDPEAWLMTLDADILLSQPVANCLDALDPRCLYSARRRMCGDFAAWDEFMSGSKVLSDFPLDVVRVVDGKLWGTIEAQNPAGLAGYFQLWHPAASIGLKQFPATGSAEAYDLMFGLSFPDEARAYLSAHDTLHLGPTEVNWAGRRSPRWERS